MGKRPAYLVEPGRQGKNDRQGPQNQKGGRELKQGVRVHNFWYDRKARTQVKFRRLREKGGGGRGQGR